MWYRIAWIALALWALCLFTGQVFDGRAHVLLIVSLGAMVAAVLKDPMQLMP